MLQKIRTALRFAVFIAVFLLLLSYVTGFFIRESMDTDETNAFYFEPENSIDVLYVGSSPIVRGVSPMLIYEQHGFAGYMRATVLQAPAVTYALLAEALETQTPSLVVLRCDNILQTYEYDEREADLRRVLDGMRPSLHKLKVVLEVTKSDERQSALSYFFPLLRYHDRWKTFVFGETEQIIRPTHSVRKGHLFLNESKPQAYPEHFMQPLQTGANPNPYDENAVMHFTNAIKLCTDNNIPVLVVHFPSMHWSLKRSEAMAAFAAECGADYLDMDLDVYREAIGLNPETDYYDGGHVNTAGSLKVSAFLGDYMDVHYNLPDRRNDPAYALWDEDLLAYKDILEGKTEGKTD